MSDAQATKQEKYELLKKQLQDKGRWNVYEEDKVRRQLNLPVQVTQPEPVKVETKPESKKKDIHFPKLNNEINKLFEKGKEMKIVKEPFIPNLFKK